MTETALMGISPRNAAVTCRRVSSNDFMTFAFRWRATQANHGLTRLHTS